MKGWEHLKFWRDTWPTVHDYVAMRIRAGAKVFPEDNKIFRAFETTSFDNVKIVILGQDPYHTEGKAHGLAFSVPCTVKNYPPSLRNILAEYVDDLGYRLPVSGDLTPWAQAGVLLLNTVLTVENGKPNSHAGIGWERLTYEVIRSLSDKKEGVAFMLWGKKAQEYAGLIDTTKHHVLCTPHPSPLARGYRGSRPFSSASKLLGITNDIWRLP